MADHVEEKMETNLLRDMSFYYDGNPAEGMDLQYVMAGSTDMHIQCRVERICDYAEHSSTKRPSAISPLLHCETTAVPFMMASRLIFTALFYLHIM